MSSETTRSLLARLRAQPDDDVARELLAGALYEEARMARQVGFAQGLEAAARYVRPNHPLRQRLTYGTIQELDTLAARLEGGAITVRRGGEWTGEGA